MERPASKFTKLNQWVTLVESTSKEDNSPYFHLKVPDYVFILAITSDGFIPLVTQFREPHSRLTLELPAGLVENNLSPSESAICELAEETGIKKFGDLIEMPAMILDSGRIENKSFGFLVLNATKPSLDCQSAELDTCWVKPDELVSMALSGKIDHMGQVALILWAKLSGYLEQESVEKSI